MRKSNCSLTMYSENEELTVCLRGEIDHHGAVEIRSEIDSRISELCPKRTVIDLSEIDFMDSSGLGLIMGRYSRMQAIGGALSLRNPNARTMRIFELAGLERIIKIEITPKKESEDEG